MNIRTLEQFVALAEHLHFGRASEAVNLSVSALSRNIRQLEDAVGSRLFERDNRSVSMTEAGRRFLTYAREATASWSAICHEMASREGELSGEISLYCSVTASYGLLAPLLERCRAMHPGIEIKLHTGDPENGIARVIAGKEDIAIAARPDHLPKGAVFQQLAVSPLVFIVSRARLQTVPPTLDAKDFNSFKTTPMIVAERGVARRRVDAWFRASGVTPRIYAQVAGNEAIVAMVSLGLGIGVVPRIVLDNSPLATHVQILKSTPALAPYDVGEVLLKRRLEDPLVAAFWNMGRDERDHVVGLDTEDHRWAG